jgi:periplasmic mercuric ion binding protein
MKSIAIILSILALSIGQVFGQKGIEEIKIKTSSQCEMCKHRLEESMAFERGVKKSSLDLETGIITVSYQAKRTNPDQIRLAISKTGYDADEVAAEPKAYAKLPACCKKPDDPAYKPH